MAIGKASDFVIRHELFNTVFVEEQRQNVDVFNAGSANTIRMVTQSMQGDYNKERFFDRPSGGYVRRDTTDTSTDLTPSKLTQDEIIGVKLNRRYGPYSQTLDSFKKVNMTAEDMSRILAVNMAEEKQKKMANDAIKALVAAIRNQSAAVYDYADTGANATVDTTALIRTRQLFGDEFGKIRAWVSNSDVYFGLAEEFATAAGGGSGAVGDVVMNGGAPATLGLPFLVSDSSDFSTSGTPGEYHVLGLVENAAVVASSEPPTVGTDQQLLKENIELIFQGEDAYNITLKGFEWDITSTGANPSDANLGTGSNWDLVVASFKDAAGVALDVDQS